MSGKSGVRFGTGRLVLMALSVWVIAMLTFAGFPTVGRFAALSIYVAGGVFAIACVVWAASLRHRPYGSRLLWPLMLAGLTFRLLGDGSWGVSHLLSGGPTPLWAVYAAYGASYLLFLTAMLTLATRVAREIAPIITLDAACVMFTSGMLAWHFVLGPATRGGAESPGAATVILAAFACEAGLLFLCLTMFSSQNRPPFSGRLALAFAALLVADGIYFTIRAAGDYQPGGWPEILWALGFICFGAAALGAPAGVPRSGEIHPVRVFAFWFGPLSPAVQYAVLLVWGGLNPPLPAYALWGGAALVMYLAFRISMTAYLNRRMRLDAESLAVRGEQGRISEELHDTLKQSVYSVSVMLDAYKKAHERGDPESRELLERAIEASREADFRVGRPIEELRARWAGVEDPSPLLGRLVEDFERQFGIKPHEDLQADLTRLGPEELAAAYRVTSEALWNAAKHSDARNVWLESREVGSVVLVRVRDDGKGFDARETATGYGLSSMTARVDQVGATLDIISDPLSGTTVQVRFERA